MAPSVNGDAASSAGGSSAQGSSIDLRPGQDPDENFDESKALTNGLFGVLYTVSKENDNVHWVMAAFRLFMDWLQLFLITVNPAYGYDLNPDSLGWKIFNWIQLNQFMNERGYAFFLGCMYTMVVALIANLGISIWVGYSFQNNRFDHVWPIVFLRWFANIFYQVLDIASITLFLMVFDCNYWSKPAAVTFYNQEFPDVYCWSMPHLIHVVVAGLSLLAFVSMAALYTMAQMELNPLTKNIMAMGHSKVELESFAVRVIMTFSSVFLTSTRWLSIVQLVMSALLVYLYTRWVPHYYCLINHIRISTYVGIFFTAIVFVLMAYTPYIDTDDTAAVNSYHNKLTILCWAGLGPAMLLGWALSWLRHRHFQVTVIERFKTSLSSSEESYPEDIYEVTDARQVEIIARCTRKWVDRRTLDEEAVTLGEAVLKCGITQRPKDPYMVLLYSSFLIDVLTSYQSGYTLLQSAKKCEPSLLMRFAIFSREQQHTQKAAGNAGQGTDLVSYVEFQKNYGLAIKCHKEALLAIRAFWATLMHSNVRFNQVAGAVKRMDQAIRAADRVYKMVLQRHATHVKMVQLYAKFLQHVKNDPWGAAKWFSEAEKLEQAEEDAKSNNVFGGMEMDPILRQALMTAHDDRAIIIMDAQGIIQMTNQTCHEMFGYTKTEMRGKNVNILIPPPFGEHHNSYIRTYIQTGQESTLNRSVQQIALHKDRRVLTIRLQTAKLSGIGEDSVFIGVMQLVEVEPDTAVIHVMSSGQILSVDDTFSDWTGFKAADLAGGNATSLMVKPRLLEELLRQAHTAIMRSEMRQSTAQLADLLGGSSHNADMQAMVAPRQRSKTAGAGMSLLAGHSHNGGGPMVSALSMVVRGPSKSIISMLGPPGTIAEGEEDEGPSGREGRVNSVVIVEPGLKLEARWKLSSALVNHKYSDPVKMDIGVCNGGRGALQFHIITFKRSPLPGSQPPPGTPPGQQGRVTPPGSTGLGSGRGMGLQAGGARPRQRVLMSVSTRRRSSMHFIAPVPMYHQEYLLVSTPHGVVVHVTSALATLLGSTPKALMGNGAPNVLSRLMPEPFATLHRQLAKSLPVSQPPPWSCRSGLAVLLNVSQEGSAGMGTSDTPSLAFRLALKRRMGLEETYHVAALEPVTMQQALDERCLTVVLNQAGLVKNVSATPASTFGFDPQGLLGKSVADFLDVFEAVAEEDTELGAAGPGVPRLLSLLLAGSSARPGLGWRVGVLAPVDEVEAMTLGDDFMANALMSREEQPAVMTMKAHMVQGRQLSNPALHVGNNSNLEIVVQLWAAGSVSSVVELDSTGRVVSEQDGAPARALLYPPGLVLGLTPSAMQGHHIRNFLPLGTKSVADLFTPNAFGPTAAHLLRNSSDAQAPAARAGGMKGNKAGMAQDKRIGPPQAVRVQHPADGEEYDLVVQAVHRSGHSHGTFLIMRPLQPRCGRQDLKALLEARAAQAGPAAGRGRAVGAAFMKESAYESGPEFGRASFAGVRKLSPSQAAVPPLGDEEQRSNSTPKAKASAAGVVLAPSPEPLPMPLGQALPDVANPAALDAASDAGAPEAGEGSHASAVGDHDNSLDGAGAGEGTPPGPGREGAEDGVVVRSARGPELRRAGTKDSAIHKHGSGLPGRPATTKEASIHAWVATGGAQYPVDGQALADMEAGDLHKGGRGGSPAPLPKYSLVRPFSQGSEHGHMGSMDGSHSDGQKKDGADSDSDKDSRDQDQPPPDHDGHANTSGAGTSEGGGEGDVDGDLDEEANYKRGQRYKKLMRLVSSPQVQRVMLRYKHHTSGLLAALVAVHTGIFVLMMVLIKQQSQAVMDLNNIGLGARYATEIAITTRALNVHFDNMTVDHLRLISDPADLPRLMGLYNDHIQQFEWLHQGAYLGFNTKRRLPDVGRLHDIWESPYLNESIFYHIPYNESLNNFTIMEQKVQERKSSLWDMGNLFLAKALYIYRTGEERYYGPNKTEPGLFFDDHDVNYIIENYVSIIEGYLWTMDDMVIHVIDSAVSINNVQVIILIAEGCALCLVVVCYVWILVQQVARHRYSMYLVFMSVPQTLLRTLATKRMNLTEDGDEEDDDITAPGMMPAAQQQPAGKVEDAPAEKAEKGASKPKQSVKFGGGESTRDVEKGASAEAAYATGPGHSSILSATGGRPAGGGSGFFGSLAFWRSRSVRVAPNTKRQLLPSLLPSIWLTWPFLTWGIIIVVINLVAHNMLGQVDGPIATFNIVNFVTVLYQRNLYYLQELTFEPELRHMEMQRHRSYDAIQQLRKEYMVMLYGIEAYPNETSTHYTLVKDGVLFSTGAGVHILFETEDCLCEDQIDCMPETNHLYAYTHKGLHRMVERYLELGDTILDYQFLDPYLNGPVYEYFWNTKPDMTGGFSLLDAAYSDHVKSVYNMILTLHIIAFVLTWATVICYYLLVLRPFMNVTHNEARRIAELLSQLPFELDIESLLARNLLLNKSKPPAPGSGQPGATLTLQTLPTQSSLGRGQDISVRSGNSGGMGSLRLRPSNSKKL